jgi:hypothetical protein
MWRTFQILQTILIALGLLLAFGSNQFSIPILLYAGVGCFGLAMIMMGWQAILTQHMVLHRRRGRYRQTYTGAPAIFQGVQFNFLGLFLIGIAFMMYFNNGQEIFLQIVRRPGLFLVLLGGLSLLQSILMFWGSQGPGQESRGIMILVFVFSRLYPGLIWLVMGLVLSALGLIDALAPARFDEMGGRFLEELYGLR